MTRDGHGQLRQQLVRTCLDWQRRLRLADWRVSIELHDPEALEGNLADVQWALSSKTAKMRLLAPEYDLTHDMEHSIVHELLHLHLAPLGIEDETPEDDAQETAIELIAGSLVALSREIAA